MDDVDIAHVSEVDTDETAVKDRIKAEHQALVEQGWAPNEAFVEAVQRVKAEQSVPADIIVENDSAATTSENRDGTSPETCQKQVESCPIFIEMVDEAHTNMAEQASEQLVASQQTPLEDQDTMVAHVDDAQENSVTTFELDPEVGKKTCFS